MSPRHPDIYSHPSHYRLDPHTSPFKVMVTFEAWSSIEKFAFHFVAIRSFYLRYRKFQFWPWKFLLMAKVKPWRSHLRLKFHWYACFSFRGNRTILRYSKFHIRSWKFKVKVMAKVKPGDPIWGLAYNRYVCILFCGNETIFGWDTANSRFDLEVPFLRYNLTLKIQGQRSRSKVP